jgi:hypothetical protein
MQVNLDGIWVILGGLILALKSCEAGRQLSRQIGHGDKLSQPYEWMFLIGGAAITVVGVLVLVF